MKVKEIRIPGTVEDLNKFLEENDLPPANIIKIIVHPSAGMAGSLEEWQVLYHE